VSAVGWSGGQLGKRWVCKVVSWSWRLCQRLVCSGQLTCFVYKHIELIMIGLSLIAFIVNFTEACFAKFL